MAQKNLIIMAEVSTVGILVKLPLFKKCFEMLNYLTKTLEVGIPDWLLI